MRDVIQEIVEKLKKEQGGNGSINFELVANTVAEFDHEIVAEVENRLKEAGIKITT